MLFSEQESGLFRRLTAALFICSNPQNIKTQGVRCYMMFSQCSERFSGLICHVGCELIDQSKAGVL